jgi:hypothetical protein
MEDEWIVAESIPNDEADPKALMTKWINVAEDLALIPALNVRMRSEAGMIVLEVSRELFDTFGGY